MATIQLSFNGQVVEDFTLTKETLTIGRKIDNDIHLDNLSVSGHHAKILTILNDSFIEDVGSTNGTYLNGTLIKKQILKNGDVVKIGKHQLKYVNAASIQDEDEFEKTMIINPGAAGMPEDQGSKEIDRSVNKLAKEIASADSKHKSTVSNANIRLISGANSGKELPLTKILTTLGKPGIQVAAITRRPSGYFLIHVDGGADAGRPKVNDVELGSQAQPLQNNDVIEVAGVKMTFFFA